MMGSMIGRMIVKRIRGRGRPRSDVKMVDRLNLRVLPQDLDHLGAIGEKLPGFDQAELARAAMRLGLAILELDPTLFLAAAGGPVAQDVLKSRLARRRDE
jgi:hypothetical protein